jgi:hypothetical protein
MHGFGRPLDPILGLPWLVLNLWLRRIGLAQPADASRLFGWPLLLIFLLDFGWPDHLTLLFLLEWLLGLTRPDEWSLSLRLGLLLKIVLKLLLRLLLIHFLGRCVEGLRGHRGHRHVRDVVAEVLWGLVWSWVIHLLRCLEKFFVSSPLRGGILAHPRVVICHAHMLSQILGAHALVGGITRNIDEALPTGLHTHIGLVRLLAKPCFLLRLSEHLGRLHQTLPIDRILILLVHPLILLQKHHQLLQLR